MGFSLGVPNSYTSERGHIKAIYKIRRPNERISEVSPSENTLKLVPLSSLSIPLPILGNLTWLPLSLCFCPHTSCMLSSKRAFLPSI